MSGRDVAATRLMDQIRLRDEEIERLERSLKIADAYIAVVIRGGDPLTELAAYIKDREARNRV